MSIPQSIVWNLFLVGFLFMPVVLAFVSLMSLLGFQINRTYESCRAGNDWLVLFGYVCSRYFLFLKRVKAKGYLDNIPKGEQGMTVLWDKRLMDSISRDSFLKNKRKNVLTNLSLLLYSLIIMFLIPIVWIIYRSIIMQGVILSSDWILYLLANKRDFCHGHGFLFISTSNSLKLGKLLSCPTGLWGLQILQLCWCRLFEKV